MDNPIISLKDVTICHADGPILTNVNLLVNPGEFVYLIGKSGAGKTSMLRTLYADREIGSGTEATVCGYDLMHLKRRQKPMFRRRIGIVFQNFRLLRDRNVYENLAFVLKATGWKRKDMDEQITKTLKAVGIEDKAQSSIFKLSEGEQQRVGIARALINNPDLILADEPTGNLDPATSSDIMELLVNINKQTGTTMVISTHDFMMINKYQSRLLVCEDGSLVEPQ
ncbi:MAG: ATP-binding cassette domain-containing protein [Bacteroidales bacterium]|jgi:cell division transport system ATP-binding protein|nr:ATP-binding cassette domain-containing protein [Bacteroidales bacterium]MBR3434572.1 ATP-binding cassette domain-containing protein [Bacteroidales bacterium]